MAVNPGTQGIIILALGWRNSSTSPQSLWNSAVFRQDDARNIAALVVGIHLCTKLPGKLGMRLSSNPPSRGTFFLLAEKYYQRSTKPGRFLEPVQEKSNCSWHVKVYQAWFTVWKLFFLLLTSVFSLFLDMKRLSNFHLWLLWYGERAKEGKEWKLCWSKLGKWAFGQHLWVYHNWCQVLLSHLEKEKRKLTVWCSVFSSAHVEASLRSMLPCFVIDLVNGECLDSCFSLHFTSL